MIRRTARLAQDIFLFVGGRLAVVSWKGYGILNQVERELTESFSRLLFALKNSNSLIGNHLLRSVSFCEKFLCPLRLCGELPLSTPPGTRRCAHTPRRLRWLEQL
jgi:hypothetical protein